MDYKYQQPYHNSSYNGRYIDEHSKRPLQALGPSVEGRDTKRTQLYHPKAYGEAQVLSPDDRKVIANDSQPNTYPELSTYADFSSPTYMYRHGLNGFPFPGSRTHDPYHHTLTGYGEYGVENSDMASAVLHSPNRVDPLNPYGGLGNSIFQSQPNQPFVEESDSSDKDEAAGFHVGNDASDLFVQSDEPGLQNPIQETHAEHSNPARFDEHWNDEPLFTDRKIPGGQTQEQPHLCQDQGMRFQPVTEYNHATSHTRKQQALPVQRSLNTAYDRSRDPRVMARVNCADYNGPISRMSPVSSAHTAPVSMAPAPKSSAQGKLKLITRGFGKPSAQRGAPATRRTPAQAAQAPSALPAHNASARTIKAAPAARGQSAARNMPGLHTNLQSINSISTPSISSSPAPASQATTGSAPYPGKGPSLNPAPRNSTIVPTRAVSQIRTAQKHSQAATPDIAKAFSEAQIRAFQPNNLDRQIQNWRLKSLSWSDVSLMLSCNNQKHNLMEVQVRQKLLEAKLSLEKRQAPPVGKVKETVLNQRVRDQSIIPQPSAPTNEADALSLAVTREKDKLAWQEERKTLQQSLQAVEKQLLTEREKTSTIQHELDNARTELQSKIEVEDRLTKQMETSQHLRERLQDESTRRARLEREWKEQQTAEHRKNLAQAASTRPLAKAQGTGFVFPDADTPNEECIPDKKSSQSKKKASCGVREDGHPNHGGKRISQKMVQKYLAHLEKSHEDEDDMPTEEQELPEKLQDTHLTFFQYTVYRKQWLKEEPEPDTEGIACGQYTYLNKANQAVQREVLRPWGSDGITIEHDKDFALQGGKDEHNMAWSQIEVPAGYVKVWVERQVHTAYEGALPLFEPKAFLSKTVFAIKTSRKGSMVEDTDEIYTTLDLANKKASDKMFNLFWGEASMRYDDIIRKNEADKTRKQKLEDLEDTKELFSEEVEENGGLVKIWVVEKTLTGPRN